MDHQIRVKNLFQRCPKRRHKLCRQIRDEPNGVRQDHPAPGRKVDTAHGGIKRGKDHVLCHDIRTGQPIENRGFTGVRVSDKRDNRERNFLARRPVQLAGLHDLSQLPLQADDGVINRAPVGLDLGFAGTAHKAAAAALSFQVGPTADKPGFLIGQMRQINLQHPFAGARPFPENLQDQRRAIQHLKLPGLFQIPLLDRRDGAIDHHQVDLGIMKNLFQFLNLSPAKEFARIRFRRPQNLGSRQIDIQRAHKAFRFGKCQFRVAGRWYRLKYRMQQKGPHQRSVIAVVILIKADRL